MTRAGNHAAEKRRSSRNRPGDRALRESEERFRAIFESARDCVFVKDRELRYTHVNPAMGELFRRPPEDLVGLSDGDLFDETTVARVRAVDECVLRGDVRDDVSSSLVNGVEHVFHAIKVPLYDADGDIIGLCGIARDITDLKRAEAVERTLGNILHAAATSADVRSLIEGIRELLGRLIDTTNFYVALYDPATDRYSFPYYVDSYDSLERFEPEPLPKSLTDYVRRTGTPLLAGARVFEELVARGEVALVGTDSKIWLGAPLVTERGVIGVVVVQSYDDASLYSQKDLELLDHAAGTISIVVERKRAEEQRRMLETRLLQAQKIESLGVLAGGIAHEFNNLLQTILGGSGLAARLLPDGSPVHDQLAMIESAANSAAVLTRQMLAYSGKSGFAVEDVDVSRLIAELSGLMAASTGPGRTLNLDLADKLPVVKADPAAVQQVVLNLVTNASEAIADGHGAITVTTGVARCDRSALERMVLGDVLVEGSYVFLRVTDAGTGMDARTKARIFDPFFSTRFAGRGLGLAAVLGIVRGLRGAIRVDTEVGVGTSVWIFLPAADDVTPTAPIAVGHDDWATGGVETVLVVDDDDVVRSLTRQMLEEAGFEVLTASDGRRALEVFERAAARIDVVLLDMTMPRMDGETTFGKLREMQPDIRVIVSSGYSEQDALERFRAARPNGFLQKPYRLSTLVDTVRGVTSSP